MKNFILYNRTITDIEKGVFYYEIINGEKDSNNEFIVYKTPIEIEDISENSNWEEELLKEKNLGQLTQLRKKIRDDEIQCYRIGNLNRSASMALNTKINDYKNMPKLNYAVNDAVEIRKLLIRKYNFKDDHIKMILRRWRLSLHPFLLFFILKCGGRSLRSVVLVNWNWVGRRVYRCNIATIAIQEHKGILHQIGTFHVPI